MKKLAFATFSLILVSASLCQAETTESCIEAHVEAQKLRTSFRLLDARSKLEECGAQSCPSIIRSECGKWLEEVKEQIPSIVPVPTTQDGTDVVDVTIMVDGVRVTASPGTAIGLDPGQHGIAVEASGYNPVELKLTANVGEQDRRIPVRLTPVATPSPTWPYVAFGAGIVAGTSLFVAMGTMARNEERELASSCEPTCSQDRIDRVRTEYLFANIGLAVAAASLAGAGVYYLYSRSTVSAQPSATGASLNFQTRF